MSIENWLIREDLEGGVTRLVLNRPPVNALNSDFLDLLGAHLDRLQADTAVKAVILASNSKVLSAGMDLKEALGFDLKDQQAMVRVSMSTLPNCLAFQNLPLLPQVVRRLRGAFFWCLPAITELPASRRVLGWRRCGLAPIFRLDRWRLPVQHWRRMICGG